MWNCSGLNSVRRCYEWGGFYFWDYDLLSFEEAETGTLGGHFIINYWWS